MSASPAEKTSFFRALSGVCRGTEIFHTLIRQKAWRIAVHLLLLLGICSAAVPSVRMIVDREKIRQSLTEMRENFGAIRVYPRQMVPSLRPEEMRVVILGGTLPVIYVPGETLPDWKQYAEYPVLPVWQPDQLSFVQRLSDTEAVISSFPLGIGGTLIPEPRRVRWDALSEALHARAWQAPEGELIAENDFELFRGMLWMTLCGIFWLEAVPPLLIFLSLFIGVFTLTSTVRDRTLRFSELIKVGAYASMPVILVASFFPALDLPLLEYSTAYMIGAVCYFIVAVNRLERDRHAANAGQEEQGRH